MEEIRLDESFDRCIFMNRSVGKENLCILSQFAYYNGSPALAFHGLHSHVIADADAMRLMCWYPQFARISDNLQSLRFIRCRAPSDPVGQWLPGSGCGINHYLSVTPAHRLSPSLQVEWQISYHDAGLTAVEARLPNLTRTVEVKS